MSPQEPLGAARSVVPALKTLTTAWEVSRFSKKVAKTFKRGFKFSKRVGGVEILKKVTKTLQMTNPTVVQIQQGESEIYAFVKVFALRFGGMVMMMVMVIMMIVMVMMIMVRVMMMVMVFFRIARSR